jgi:hypothetical protein
LSASRAARRRRCRAVFRPKIATGQAYRHLQKHNFTVWATRERRKTAVNCANNSGWVA